MWGIILALVLRKRLLRAAFGRKPLRAIDQVSLTLSNIALPTFSFWKRLTIASNLLYVSTHESDSWLLVDTVAELVSRGADVTWQS